MRCDFAGDAAQLRGLVAEHDEIGAPRHLCVVGERLAAELLDERVSPPGERIGAQHRPPPPARKRTSHVACAYETYLHCSASVSADSDIGRSI